MNAQLVFSQCLGELDLIEHFLKRDGTAKCHSWVKNVDYYRMDGTVSPAHRTTICDLFNDRDNKKLRLLLMSTKVGGLGLNLTAANRVVIMTVNWNPSYDIQSIFRVYRFGQEKEVFVYRLIALDSMEEKVYQRTVTKLAIAHRVVDKHQITRHYKSMDLRELYSCRPSADITRTITNEPEDKVLSKLKFKLPYIFKHHEHQALLANRPEDNLNEQELKAACDEFKRNIVTPQVPPPQTLQQVQQALSTLLSHVPLASGPTFSMAYDLTKTNLSTNSGTKVGDITENTADGLGQYFIPKPSRANYKQVSKVQSEKDSTNKNTIGHDPLYVPSSTEVIKTNKSYKQFTIPKLPSTTIVLDDLPHNKNQKQDQRPKKFIDISKLGDNSIIVLEDDSDKDNIKKVAKNNMSPLLTSNKPKTSGTKRKNSKTDTLQILKKMKMEFNNHTNHITPITVDDGDESVVTDTSSEARSLTNELITNLGRSGITIRKVMNSVKKSDDIVITLD